MEQYGVLVVIYAAVCCMEQSGALVYCCEIWCTGVLVVRDMVHWCTGVLVVRYMEQSWIEIKMA